jgi:uncharacterized membrane protein
MVGVAIAVLLPVLIGFAGIGIEVGVRFVVQRQNQSAADAVAISAALEYAAHIESGVPVDHRAAVASATTNTGYNPFSNAHCSTSGTSTSVISSRAAPAIRRVPTGRLNAVQAVLTQRLNTVFASLATVIWGPGVRTINVTPTGIAALPRTSTGCLLDLRQTGAESLSPGITA